MKVAVLGGSFNPLHAGHAMLAETVVKELGYDKVLFVPTFVPPHKEIKSGVTPEQRLGMIQAFCDSIPEGWFEAEPCEIERGGVSYTYDTLVYLNEKYKGKLDGKLAFILGDEMGAEFHKWHNPDGIVEIADLIITHRYPDLKVLEKTLYGNVPSGDYSGDFSTKFDLENFKYPCTYLSEPVLPVSSTDVRKRVAEGRSFKYLVPEAVFEYITKNKLYL